MKEVGINIAFIIVSIWKAHDGSLRFRNLKSVSSKGERNSEANKEDGQVHVCVANVTRLNMSFSLSLSYILICVSIFLYIISIL